jgi:phosphatidylserine/phosphatidylglycerophosphate/cardiolipin synthase-like enzyme
MPGFFSPLTDLTSWTLTSPPGIVTLPPSTRYAGYPLLGVRATANGPPAALAMPALGILRKVTPATGPAAVEIQVNPFPIRRVMTRLAFGCPTFYLLLPDASGLTGFADGDTAIGAASLGTAAEVTIVMAGQDRIARHPATWATMIETAITGAAGTPASWSDFRAAVAAALVPAGEPPLIVLDHTGAPRTSGYVRLIAGVNDIVMNFAPQDAGDVQRTLKRSTIARPSVFAGGVAGVTVAMSAAGDHQVTRLEGGAPAANQIVVPNTGGHVMSTNLPDWFAQQFAGAALPRYTRGNTVRTFVNGPEFFDNLFREIHHARNGDGGLHLAGWAMEPEVELATKRADDAADFARTLEFAAEGIATDGGASRFLPSRLYNLESAGPAAFGEIALFGLITGGLALARNLPAYRTDAGGLIVLGIVTIANVAAVAWVLAEDGRPLEPNGDAVEMLDVFDRATSTFATFPADIADNPSAPNDTLPFAVAFNVIRHFGVYHQKLAIVKGGVNSFVGYCGGIDLCADRLDDARHLNAHPFHDVHARFEGPAVRDLALTFEQRWERDARGALDEPAEPLAFETPTVASLGTPGTNVVQIARTYFKAAASTRALEFAPQGDRTIADTLLRAIGAAREFIYIEDQYFTPPKAYRDALTAAVSGGAIKRLVITVPGITDQPFGEIVRTSFIGELLTADAGRGIVRIGYPRRHYTLPDNETRASSGRCTLTEDLVPVGGVASSVCLGPTARVPPPPFWLAIDGELMYVDDEARAAFWNPAPDNSTRYTVVRGDSTRLIKGGATPKGATIRNHTKGAAASVVDLSNIYVHSKMMIVDDVFLSLGSANLNRRGLFHDGEINAFTVPHGLKGGAENPVRNLRLRLWAEMLDLPETLAAPLLEDPVAATALFDRSPLLGNRYTDIEAYPEHVMFGANGGDGIVTALLDLLKIGLVAGHHAMLFDGVVDPTSGLEGP